MYATSAPSATLALALAPGLALAIANASTASAASATRPPQRDPAPCDPTPAGDWSEAELEQLQSPWLADLARGVPSFLTLALAPDPTPNPTPNPTP
jgi:hypothetical protein